jgi:acetyltransferase
MNKKIKTQKNSLNNFFNPKSIAVIGASSDEEKLGYGILKNILDYNYKGKIFPVNLKGGKILGLKVYNSVLEIKSRIDLAIIVIPAKAVNYVLEECGKGKIKNVIVISAGFKEVGGDGVILEKEMMKVAEKYNIKIVGPNCLGILNSENNLNASFANGMVKKGSIGFISQSGALCSAMLDWANLNEVGFSRFVSLGNKVNISEIEMLDFFKNDKKTKAVLAYLENINKGIEFMKAAAELAKIKPLIFLKPGKSKASQKAMASHTGALANEEMAIKTAFRQTGVVRVDNLEELFNSAKFLSRYDCLKNNRVAIITNAGGPGVICADDLEKNNLKLASLSKNTINIFKKNLPPTAAINNPVDVIGDAKADRYKIVLKTLLSDKNVDGIIFILTPQRITEIKKTANDLINLSKEKSKPILASFVGGRSVEKVLRELNKSPLAIYNYPSQSASVLGKFWQSKQSQKTASDYLKMIKKDTITKNKKTLKSNPDFIKSLDILKSYKIPTVKSLLAENSDEAVKAARKIKYPVAMKIFSSRISHKTEVEGVKINIKNDFEVKEYYDKIYKKLGDKLEGIIIQPMISGVEIILGVKRDENFGHLIMFGLGGIYAEAINDVSFRLAPINKSEALRMIKEIKSFKILNGYRSLPKMNIDSIAEALVSLSNLISKHEEIKELDINPLIITEKECFAVDVRIEI